MSVARVKEAAQQADEMIADLARQNQEGVTEPPSSDGDSGPGDDAAVNDSGVADETNAPQEGAVQEGESQETPAGPEPDALKQELETERQRHQSLQEMVRKRDEQINQLHELLAGMQQARESAPQDTTQSEQPLLTSEDSQNFGEDLVDMARRAARQELQSFEQQLNEIRQQIKGVSQTTEQFTEQSFEQQLDTFTENKWRKLDSDPLFIDWLGANRHRQAVFKQAVNQRDAQTVADTFNEYVREQTQQAEQQAAPRRERQQQLQKQVSPGKARSTGANVQDADEPKMWTRSEIASAYANSKQYPKEEFARLERDIAAAQKAGRVDFSR